MEDQGGAPSSENDGMSRDKPFLDVPRFGHSLKLQFSEKSDSSNIPQSTCSVEDNPEDSLKQESFSNQPQKARTVSIDKFVLVRPASGRDSLRRQTDRDAQQNDTKLEDRQFFLLPRPTLQTWNSLALSSENANEVSFGDFSSPSSTSHALSNATRSLGSADEVATASPSTTRLDDMTVARSGVELDLQDHTKSELPILDFSNSSPFALLPNFTPPQAMAMATATSRDYPRMKLLQRKEQRSNPFAFASIANTADSMQIDGALAAPPHSDSWFTMVDDSNTPESSLATNARSPSSPTLSAGGCVAQAQPGGPIQYTGSAGQQLDDSSFQTPIFKGQQHSSGSFLD